MSAPAHRPRDPNAEAPASPRARRGRRTDEERAATRARRRTPRRRAEDAPRAQADAPPRVPAAEPDVPVRRSQRTAEPAAEQRTQVRPRRTEPDEPETTGTSTRTRRARDRRGASGRRPGTGGARADAPGRAERGDRPGRLGRARAFATERVRRTKGDGRAAGAEAGEASGSRASFVVAIIALLVVGVVTTLWLSTQAIADSYRLEAAKEEAARLAEEAAVLQREVSRMESAPELARRARELGMVPAGDPAWLVVQENGKVKVVGDPTPAQAPPKPTTAPPAAPSADTQAGGGQADSDAQTGGGGTPSGGGDARTGRP